MSRPLGRPTLLSKEIQDAICLAIRTTKMSMSDCAESAGLEPATVYKWMAVGKKESSGPFHDFFIEVKRARADGSKMLLARIAKAGQDPKHWQANAALLAMTEPQYAPKVRLAVEEQLEAAVDALTREFADEPDALQRALRAIGESDQ